MLNQLNETLHTPELPMGLFFLSLYWINAHALCWEWSIRKVQTTCDKDFMALFVREGTLVLLSWINSLCKNMFFLPNSSCNLKWMIFCPLLCSKFLCCFALLSNWIIPSELVALQCWVSWIVYLWSVKMQIVLESSRNQGPMYIRDTLLLNCHSLTPVLPGSAGT